MVVTSHIVKLAGFEIHPSLLFDLQLLVRPYFLKQCVNERSRPGRTEEQQCTDAQQHDDDRRKPPLLVLFQEVDELRHNRFTTLSVRLFEFAWFFTHGLSARG